MNEFNFVDELLQVSPPIGLVLAINVFLMLLKKIPSVPHWSLPIIAVVIGAFCYPLLTDPAKVSFAVKSPLLAQTITGILIGYAAVGAHQKFRQLVKRFGMHTGDTDQWSKHEVKNEQ